MHVICHLHHLVLLVIHLGDTCVCVHLISFHASIAQWVESLTALETEFACSVGESGEPSSQEVGKVSKQL